jgi:hypothetical protein
MLCVHISAEKQRGIDGYHSGLFLSKQGKVLPLYSVGKSFLRVVTATKEKLMKTS